MCSAATSNIYRWPKKLISYKGRLKGTEKENKKDMVPCAYVDDRTDVHLEASSQRTRPQAYMSIRRKASLEKLIAPSRTSGAM